MAVTEEKKLNIQSITEGKLTWVYIEKPSAAEVEFLKQHFKFHPLNLDDIVSRIQRPKIDEYDDHLFIVLHFPVFDKEKRITRPSEVDVFIGENYIVTVHCSTDLKPLAKFFTECQLSEEMRRTYLGRSSGFLLYHILDRLVNYCFPILGKITESIDDVENIIFTKAVPETVREISIIRRDLISFRRVIHPQIPVIEMLEREEYSFFKEDQEAYFGDIADHTRKIWDGLEDCKEVVDGFADTSNWLTSHRIQETMRVLTIFMAIIMPVEVVASIEGSNLLPTPWLHNPPIFYLSLFVQLGIVAGMLIYFRHRRWL
jgi:magnesium transporter